MSKPIKLTGLSASRWAVSEDADIQNTAASIKSPTTPVLPTTPALVEKTKDITRALGNLSVATIVGAPVAKLTKNKPISNGVSGRKSDYKPRVSQPRNHEKVKGGEKKTFPIASTVVSPAPTTVTAKSRHQDPVEKTGKSGKKAVPTSASPSPTLAVVPDTDSLSKLEKKNGIAPLVASRWAPGGSYAMAAEQNKGQDAEEKINNKMVEKET